MALVAAAVANRGQVPVPTVVHEIVDSDGALLDEHDPGVWTEAVQPGAAEAMRLAMIETAQSGTATAMAIPGFEVGGKTGTAQLGVDPPQSHAWVIGFAGPQGEEPTVAIAVIVEADPDLGNLTGGTVAAPIARAVLEVALSDGA
jgi:peptidoglycan glycosyltransferase